MPAYRSIVATAVLSTFLAGPGTGVRAEDSKARARSVKVVVLSTMLADTRGLGEWGFAALVEVDGRRILFDTGHKPDTVLKNVKEMGIDLTGVKDVILSHHHTDHTGGLLTLRREVAKADPQALSTTYVGAGLFLPRSGEGGRQTNETIDMKAPYEAGGGKFVEVARPTELYPGVWLTGPVPRTYPERNWSGRGQVRTDKGLEEDNLPEDMSLVIDTDRGLVVVTGCGHAGVVNTVEYAQKTVRKAPVHALLGGIHLFPADEKTLRWTGEKLRAAGVENFLGAHCTGIETVYDLRPRLGLDRAHCVVGAVGAGFEFPGGLRPGTIAH